MPADGRCDGGAAAVERHGHEVEPERLLEHFTGEIARGSQAGMGIAVLARACLHPGDKLLHVRRRNVWVHQQNLRRHSDQRHRREVAGRVETELVEQARIDHQRAADHQHGVAVGGSLGRHRSADIAAAPGVVLHVELLAQPLRQLRRKHARHDIDRAARRERRDHLHRPVGVVRGLGQACAGDKSHGKPERDCLHCRGSLVTIWKIIPLSEC